MLTDASASAIPIALLGADALLAARPATPVQVLHACLAAGFAAAYPVSWGDELIARECLSRLRQQPPRRCVLCACPHAVGTILREHQRAEPIAVASPPVAAARLVRGAYHGQTVRITYVGGCPSGADPALDAHVTPAAFLATLRERGIDLAEQPSAFEAVLPPDRRRFHSIPGGCPDADRLTESGYELVTRGEIDPLSEAMPHGEAVLFDVAAASGCVCSGAPDGRRAVAELEPPRAPHAIIDPVVAVDLSPNVLTAVVLAANQGAKATASRLGESLGASPIAFDIEPQLSTLSSAADAATDESARAPLAEPEALVADAVEAVAEPLEGDAESVAAFDAPTLGMSDATVPSDEPPPPIVDSSAPSDESPVVITDDVAPDDFRREAARRDTPAGQRGYSAKEAPLRGGPVREFAIPVFPRSESVYEDEPERPRFSMTTVLLALVLGLALPLAAFGGWVLVRYGPGIIRSRSTVSFIASDSASSSSIVGTSVRPLDSAAGSVTDTATPAASVSAESTRVDSAVAHRDARRDAPPLAEHRATPLRHRRETAAVPTRPVPVSLDSTRRTAERWPATDTARSADSALHTAPTILPWDVDSLMREIARRRARVDSLNRLVDSLKRPAVRAKPPR